MDLDNETAQMYAEYSSGLSMNKLGAKYGMSPTSIRKRFLKRGYKRRNLKEINKARAMDIPIDKIKELYIDNKLSSEKIADIFGCSRTLIANKILEAGFNRTPQESISYSKPNYTYWSREFTDAVGADLEHTKCLVETAAKFNITADALQIKNKATWNIQVQYWSEENTRMAKELLELHRDYSTVANILNISERALIDKNFSALHVDLTDNCNLFGIPTAAKDGRKYRSKIEAEVADYLFDNGITFDYEVQVCPERRWKCDFKIGDLWIELDGLASFRHVTGDKPYDSGNPKIAYYKENNFHYLILKRSGWKKDLAAALGLYIWIT